MLAGCSDTSYYRSKNTSLIVLCYHTITDKLAPLSQLGSYFNPDSLKSNFTISENSFQEQIQYLHQKGYHTISLNDLSGWLEGEKGLPSKSILITFDDGDKSVYEKAYPILKKYGFVGTLFIVTNFLDTNNMLSTKQVMEMINNGFSVGSHSVTHQSVAKLRNQPMRKEILGSKIGLEKLLNRKIDYFAYPFGYFTERVEKAIEEAGYKGAFTTIPGKNKKETNRFELRRWVVYKNTHMEDFIKLIEDDQNLLVISLQNLIPQFMNGGLLRPAEIMFQTLSDMDKENIFAKNGLQILRFINSNKTPDKSFIASLDKNPHIRKLETRQLLLYLVNNEVINYIFDNSSIPIHRSGYNGAISLMHKQQNKNVFLSYFSGMNYELSVLGWDKEEDHEWEPRGLPMTIKKEKDGSVVLHQKESEPRGIETIIKFSPVEPHCIDQIITFVFHKKVGKISTFSSLFASYINRPQNINLYLYGHTDNDKNSRWLEITKSSYEASDYTVYNIPDDVVTVSDHLTNHEKQQPSQIKKVYWDRPYYYGFYENYVFIMMFRDPKTVEFAYSPSGTARIGEPAWDYGFVLNNYEINKPYHFEARLCYKRFVSRWDIEHEFKQYLGYQYGS